MEIIKTIEIVKQRITNLKSKGFKIGFVPTMGALHQGHISLVQRCKTENNITVCSIFINPTQFNNKEDLANYPKTLDADLKLLEHNFCDIVFVPDEKEMYPEIDSRVFDFEGLDTVMEGKYREGHFNGVAQIVSKLFEIVQPNKAYFGKKDFQQYIIIKKLSEKYLPHLKIEIIPCKIIRESDGLAMSSRNVRLSQEQRYYSALISETLFKAQDNIGNKSVKDLKELVINTINENIHLKTEYFDIVDSNTLKSITSWEDANEKRACIAVNVGDVRLIDNVKM